MANDINIRIGAKLDSLQRELKKAQRQLTNFANFAESTGQDLTARLTLPIVGVGAAAVTTFARFDRIEKGLQVFAGSADAAGEQFDRLNAIVNDTRTTLDLETAAKGVQRLQTMGLSAYDAENAMRQFGIVATNSGSSVEEVGGAIRQFGQILAKGKAEQEDFNTLFENLGGLSKVIRDEFGVKTAEDLRATGISMEDFVLRTISAIENNEKLQSVQGGLAKSFESFGNSVTVAIKPIGESIAKAINLEENLARLSAAIARAGEAFANLNPNVQRIIIGLAAAAAAAGPLLLAMGAITKAGLLLSTGWSTLTGVFGKILNPLAGISGRLSKLSSVIKLVATDSLARGVALAKGLTILKRVVLSIINPVNLLLVGFTTGFAASAKFREIVGKLIGTLKDIGIAVFGRFAESVGGLGGIVKQVLAILAGGTSVVVNFISSTARLVQGVVEAKNALVSGDLSAAGRALSDGVKESFSIATGVVGDFKQVYQETLDTLSNRKVESFAVPQPIVGQDSFRVDDEKSSGAPPATGDVVSEETIENINKYSDSIDTLVSDIGRVGERARKTGTSLLEMASTSGLAADLNKSMEELGFTIEQVKPSEITLAMQEYSAAIALADEKHSVLGSSFDVISEKIGITSSALNTAIETFGANSVVVDQLKEKLGLLTEELTNLENKQQIYQSFADGINNLGKEMEKLGEKGELTITSFLKTSLNAIAQIIGALIKQGIVTAITANIGTAPGPIGLALAGLAGSAASALLKSAIANIAPPKLAKGGIIPPGFEGDRFPAMLNSGEAVIPLQKLFNFLDGQNQGSGQAVLRGQDLYLAYNRAARAYNRTGG